ncbi:APC family permease [Phenylobacterium sp.]|uniref:APC family permease n=1 Tax=Phenylobacterium sp. TaxID=1871053 RepID=UPI00374DC768
MGSQESEAADLSPHRFTRSLSGLGVIILTLSVLSPGVSIFVSGASILQQAGTGAVLAFLIGGLVCYCQTTMSAELGAAYPTAGYDAAAIGHAIGDWAGATCYIAGIVGIPLFLNISAGGIATYLHPLGLALDNHSTTFAVIGVIAVLSMLNIRANEYITGVFLLIEFGALLLVAGIGAAHVQPGAATLILHPTHVRAGAWLAAGIGLVGIAVNNASWSLSGASQALMFSEDMKRPQTIGRIILIAFALTVVLETAPVIGTIVGAHDLKAVLSVGDPFETFLGQYLPAFGLKIVSLSIAVAIFNACLAGFIGIGRQVFSMGRTRLFAAPINRALLRVIPRTDAPWVAILVIAGSTALATYIPLEFKILLLSGVGTIGTVFYVWGVLAGRRSGRTGAHTYRTPLFPLVPVLGVAIVVGEVCVLWLDAESGRKSLFICAGVYMLAYAYYRLVLMRRSEGWVMTGPEELDALVGQPTEVV